MAKETYYFPHDFNATSDPKIMRLLAVCGLQGIGMYWVIIEILHQQNDGKISEEAFNDYIDFYCQRNNSGTAYIDEIKQMLIKTELLFNKEGFVFSNRVLENKKIRKNISEARSFAGKKSAESRRQQTEKQEVRTSVQQANEQNPTKERKGKEIKGKESIERGDAPKVKPKFLPPTLEEVTEEFRTRGHPQPDLEGVKFWNHYDSKGWMIGKNKMQKWRSALAGWISREKEFLPVIGINRNGKPKPTSLNDAIKSGATLHQELLEIERATARL